MASSNNKYTWTFMNGKWGYELKVIQGVTQHTAILVGCPENVDPSHYIQNNTANGHILVRWDTGRQESVPTSDVTICKKIDGRSRRNLGNSISIAASSAVTSNPPAANAAMPAPAKNKAKRRVISTTTTNTIPKLVTIEDIMISDDTNGVNTKPSAFNNNGVDAKYFRTGVGIIVGGFGAIIINPKLGLQGDVIQLVVKYKTSKKTSSKNYGWSEDTIDVNDVTSFDECYNGNIVPDRVLDKVGNEFVIGFKGYDYNTHRDKKPHTDCISHENTFYKDIISKWEDDQNMIGASKSSSRASNNTKRPLSPSSDPSPSLIITINESVRNTGNATLAETFPPNSLTHREAKNWSPISTPITNNLHGNVLARGSRSLLRDLGSGLLGLGSDGGALTTSDDGGEMQSAGRLELEGAADDGIDCLELGGGGFTSASTSREELTNEVKRDPLSASTNEGTGQRTSEGPGTLPPLLPQPRVEMGNSSNAGVNNDATEAEAVTLGDGGEDTFVKANSNPRTSIFDDRLMTSVCLGKNGHVGFIVRKDDVAASGGGVSWIVQWMDNETNVVQSEESLDESRMGVAIDYYKSIHRLTSDGLGAPGIQSPSLLHPPLHPTPLPSLAPYGAKAGIDSSVGGNNDLLQYHEEDTEKEADEVCKNGNESESEDDEVLTYQQVKHIIENYPGDFDQIPNSHPVFSGLSCSREGYNNKFIRGVKQLHKNMKYHKTTPKYYQKQNCNTDQEKAANEAMNQISNWSRPDARKDWANSKELMILNALGYALGGKWRTREDDALKTYAVHNYGARGVDWGNVLSVEDIKHRGKKAIKAKYEQLTKEISHVPFVLKGHFLRLSTGGMIQPLSGHDDDGDDDEEEEDPYEQSTVLPAVPSIIPSGNADYDASTQPMGADADMDELHPDEADLNRGLAGHGDDSNPPKDSSNPQNKPPSKEGDVGDDMLDVIQNHRLNEETDDVEDPPPSKSVPKKGESVEIVSTMIVEMMDKSKSPHPAVAEVRKNGCDFVKNVLLTAVGFPSEQDLELFKKVMERPTRAIDWGNISSNFGHVITPDMCKRRWKYGHKMWRRVNAGKTNNMRASTRTMAANMTKAMNEVIKEHIPLRDNVPKTITVELLKAMVVEV